MIRRPQIAWAHTTLDCRDPGRSAAFWAGVLDLAPIARDDGWFVVGPTVRGGPMLYFQPVSEPKVEKARVHIDLWVDDLEAARALVATLGGSDTGESHDVRGGTVAIMRDPEGIEFCLISFPA